ncbi:hypothetical protein DMI62_20980 [Escherichia coli]|nr:hypothetical protein [Escherichia coli]
MNFRGLKINSTEAMLPDSQHGFAPVIHGIALVAPHKGV